jgi:hypothetical protein
VTVDARFVAARHLFARARRKVTPEHVRRYVPNDPGYPGYVTAFEALLREGEAALSDDFDTLETVNLTRWTPAPAGDAAFRWFRLLTCAVDLLLDDPNTPHYRLGALLVDAFALAAAGDADAPTGLLREICREVDGRGRRAGQFLFCKVGELLTAGVGPPSAGATEALCAELEAADRRLHEWYVDGEPNPCFVKSEKMLWGGTAFEQLHPDWVRLVAERFPEAPAAAAALKARLLRDGASWAKAPRTLERDGPGST